MRLAVYTDYTYMQDAEGVTGERAFVRFMVALAPEVEHLTLVGRLRPEPGRSHYALPPDVGFVGLPFYSSLTRPFAVIGSLGRSAVRFWRMLDDVDTVWLMGPYVHAVAFALLAAARGKRVYLGVRQDYPVYVHSRHPDRRWIHAAATVLERTFQTMARRWPVAVVGPDLARNYHRAKRVLTLTVSLVSDADLVAADAAVARTPATPMRVLTVGRLDREKNPLLLADAIAGLRARGVDARLDVVGDGPQRDALAARVAELGIDDAVALLGYVPIDGGLLELYRGADVFLHVSWTEGLPQVLFEAFAAGIPVVATDVGGVAAAVGDAALLVPAGDGDAAADAVRRVREEPGLRERLIRAGAARVREHTMEHEAQSLARFLAED
ncbi:GalNAc-alpha-(1-_4)-GalNAc-alpha-(1-_3)-diNAcBac-PP-undecaprenol alpha-1,4-N-acetyl-D-galactosaminyltransferase [Baekduia alba]|uniref:glycosyltransferase n=1 Tax=Baekduia alba TaxID=2997333 RepID=UPI002340D8A8|nr:glycosyltransferase [Baekduia alba]WCB95998.1 GalNAc-alpha-(1->4)-GalNAc-alpha-(1->3)-diNAcBac-PP-undecaprenol alpha-1,4-N-acetyl-D-galactosaminyltransferase [Baekduia alba]